MAAWFRRKLAMQRSAAASEPARPFSRLAFGALALCACQGPHGSAPPRPEAGAGALPSSPAPSSAPAPATVSTESAIMARGPVVPRAPADVRAAEWSNRFGFEVYARLPGHSGNLVFSPAGAAVVLAMALEGARGVTRRQMAAVLHLRPASEDASALSHLLAAVSTDPSGPSTLEAALGLWIQEGVRLMPPFVARLQNAYQAGIETVDFGAEDACTSINRWTADHTGGRIGDLCSRETVGPDTRLVLASALHMKASWEFPFGPTHTRAASFFDGEHTSPVELMDHEIEFRYLALPGAQLVELPYAGSLAMWVLVPDKVGDLAPLERRLEDEYADWSKRLRYVPIELELPRWNTLSSIEMSASLAAAGMPYAFEPRSADFGDMTPERLAIGRILQRSFIRVDEIGTEAAQATAAVMMPVALRPARAHVRADHPFVYVILDRPSGLILFIGRFSGPSAPNPVGSSKGAEVAPLDHD
jgi:serpin B